VVGDHHAVRVRLAPWQVEQLRREGLEVVDAVQEGRRVG
jgi:hypothetical protein